MRVICLALCVGTNGGVEKVEMVASRGERGCVAKCEESWEIVCRRIGRSTKLLRAYKVAYVGCIRILKMCGLMPGNGDSLVSGLASLVMV